MTTQDEWAQKLAKAIDILCIARAKERISIFVENAEGAAYHASTATRALELVEDILKITPTQAESEDHENNN